MRANKLWAIVLWRLQGSVQTDDVDGWMSHNGLETGNPQIIWAIKKTNQILPALANPAWAQVVGLDDLRAPFQPQSLCDSVKYSDTDVQNPF